jgi:hypothetical protein
LRGLKAFRVEKIAKNLALLDRLQIFAEFLHGLDPKATYWFDVMDGWNAPVSGLRLKASVARHDGHSRHELGRWRYIF